MLTTPSTARRHTAQPFSSSLTARYVPATITTLHGTDGTIWFITVLRETVAFVSISRCRHRGFSKLADETSERCGP